MSEFNTGNRDAGKWQKLTVNPKITGELFGRVADGGTKLLLRGHAVLNAEVAANEAIFKLAGIKLTESRRILLVTNAGVRIGEAITEGSELVVKVLSAIATTSILTVDSCEIQILN